MLWVLMLDGMLPDKLQDPEQTAAVPAALMVEHIVVVAVHIVVAMEHIVVGSMVVHNVSGQASELVRHNANT
jgi:hypothetical protein